MWGSILKSIVMPLVQQGLVLLIKRFKNSSEDAKRDSAIDEAVTKLKDAKNVEEKKKALRDLIRGVAALEP